MVGKIPTEFVADSDVEYIVLMPSQVIILQDQVAIPGFGNVGTLLECWLERRCPGSRSRQSHGYL